MSATFMESDSLQMVIFRLEDEEFGVPIQFIKEIIRRPEITHLPNTPQFILGVSNLRGEIIPIISLHTKFHMGSDPLDETKVVIVEVGGVTVGMQVNDVNEVLTLTGSQLSKPPAMASDIRSDFIAGVGKLNERLMIILDVENVLSDEEHSIMRSIAEEQESVAQPVA